MAKEVITKKRELEITVAALREYHDRKYKLYKVNNSMPVTDEEFDALKQKAMEVREIGSALNDFEDQLSDILRTEQGNEATPDKGDK